jgi:hypothetical protein
MNRGFWLGVVAYAIPTFVVGVAWHLAIFAEIYDRLQVYREDVIFPFGVGAILVQGAFFSAVYPRFFEGSRESWLRNGLLFALAAGLLSWSYMALAVAAKHRMAAVYDFVAIESGFVALQFLLAGPLIALAHRRTEAARAA